MVSWKSILLALWALLWGYLTLKVLQAIVFPSRQICQGFGNAVSCTSEIYTPSISEAAPLGVILLFMLIGLYVACRSLFESIRQDRLRLQALTEAASLAEIRKRRLARTRRFRGSLR